MSSIKDITLGYYNKIRNINEDLKNDRINVCRDCALFKESAYGHLCSSIYLDVDNNEAKTKPFTGAVKGCGCVLEAKARLLNAKCPANKW